MIFKDLVILFYSLFQEFGNLSILRFIFTFLLSIFGLRLVFLACSIGSLHFSHIFFMNCVMVNDRFWVVLSYDTTTSFLNGQGGLPRFINIFFGKFGQLRNIFPNVVS